MQQQKTTTPTREKPSENNNSTLDIEFGTTGARVPRWPTGPRRPTPQGLTERRGLRLPQRWLGRPPAGGRPACPGVRVRRFGSGEPGRRPAALAVLHSPRPGPELQRSPGPARLRRTGSPDEASSLSSRLVRGRLLDGTLRGRFTSHRALRAHPTPPPPGSLGDGDVTADLPGVRGAVQR